MWKCTSETSALVTRQDCVILSFKKNLIVDYNPSNEQDSHKKHSTSLVLIPSRLHMKVFLLGPQLRFKPNSLQKIEVYDYSSFDIKFSKQNSWRSYLRGMHRPLSLVPTMQAKENNTRFLVSYCTYTTYNDNQHLKWQLSLKDLGRG